MRILNAVLSLFLIAAVLLPGLPAHAQEAAAQIIPLRVSDLPQGLRYPVFSGIPFPRGMVKDIKKLRLTANDQPVPAQFEPLAKWPDGSFKSVLVGAIVEAGPSYALEVGKGGSSPEPAVPAPRLFGDVYLVVKGTEYRLSRDRWQKVTIESPGPVRTVTKFLGKLTAVNGSTSLNYEIRLYAYAGMPFVTADITVIDTRPERNVNASNRIAFEATSFGLEIPLQATHYWIGGQDNQTYEGPVSGEHTLYQRGDSLFSGEPNGFTMEYLGVGTGKRAPGWMLAAGENRTVAVFVKDFWQQFPKALTVNSKRLIIEFHPEKASHEPNAPGNNHPRPRTFYFPREGGAKTYQILVVTKLSDVEHVKRLNVVFQTSPKLLAPSQWYAQSKVFGNLLPAGPESQGYDARLNEGFLNTSFLPYWEGGYMAITFGWRDFGDRLSSADQGPVFYNDTHVGSGLYFTQFLRTQNEIWWWIAEKATRHWMDIDVSHTSRTGHWSWIQSFGPGEGHMINHEIYDHACRNLHPGHAHLSGLPDYYLLTGDRRAYEVLREAGDWMVNAVHTFYPLPLWGTHIAEAERDYAWPLVVLNEAYRATGDRKYLEAAAHAVKHLISWWQQPRNHLVNGEVVGRNDWRQGTGYWTMNPRCDNCPDGYNGCNPWMAGALLSSLIQFYEYDTDTRWVDRPLLQMMLLQCMNYVVKYGWEADKKYFVYCEATRDSDGGINHLLFPLAYLGRMVKSGVLHPEHYDTSNQWLTIAQAAFDDWKEIRWRGSTQSGFYGDECIWPADFWAIMKELSS